MTAECTGEIVVPSTASSQLWACRPPPSFQGRTKVDSLIFALGFRSLRALKRRSSVRSAKLERFSAPGSAHSRVLLAALVAVRVLKVAECERLYETS